MTPVRVPTENEERERSLSRQHDETLLAKKQKRLQNVGTSVGQYYRIGLPSDWWKPKVFESPKNSRPDYMLAILSPCQAVLETPNRQMREATVLGERKVARRLPGGQQKQARQPP